MKARLRLRVLLPTAVVALAGAGVGAYAFGGTPPLAGDDALPSTVTGTKGTLTKNAPAASVSATAWAKQANALCRTALEEADALEEPTTPEELQANVVATVARGAKLLADLSALPRPARQARDVGRFLAVAAKATKALGRAQQALAGGDTAAFSRAMDATLALDKEFDPLAVRVGAPACAKDSTKPPTALERALLKDRIVVVALYSSDAMVDRLAIEEARAGAVAAKVGFVAVEVDARDVSLLARAYSVTDAPAVLVMRRWIGAVVSFPRYVDRETVAQAADNAKA